MLGNEDIYASTSYIAVTGVACAVGLSNFTVHIFYQWHVNVPCYLIRCSKS